ncbi:16S rRNA (cytosine(1402)-N(4))-methyltransferase RsmH [Cardinium endosymbiont of Culicoides punctatus]|uniref:16S rRNA (cytosine(1402)-N(4))-methyltransferase RsmH n=1 Tax=Cardinium endosymbiont of Culicoides punctatus TaxID=2304601 RepID=UPI00105846DE|nr:16S rRNA (cytosine(1402)-N(4))-methyltransferase RsmH [Cardinium endosymbiont of Culicoides punctatus]TDG95763.1 Ribosomal RNA small subunit methyltransferase H [Cardinium endosymbiont of Culicoides punctatus]
MPTTISKSYHIPVMLDEVIQGIRIVPTGKYVDLTFGGGGHAKKIVDMLSTGHLFAFDRDADTAEIACSFPSHYLTFTRAPFRFAKEFLYFYGAGQVNGLLADLGVSSHQIDTPERGFSTRFDGILDMRMDIHSPRTAQTIINRYNVTQLAEVLHYYGEIANALSVAKAIIKARTHRPIETTGQLKDLVVPFAPKSKENQYVSKIFQAFRIEVNNELAELESLLNQSAQIIKPGGRMAIISYHSLEDRLVKNFLNTGNILGQIQQDGYGNILRPFSPLQKKPLIPSEKELSQNKRARSARLRIGIRVE